MGTGIISHGGVPFEVTITSDYDEVTNTSEIKVQVVGVGELLTPAILSTINSDKTVYEEGESAYFTVSLNKATAVVQTFSCVLSGSAGSGDYESPVFTNGVTLVGSVLTVPAGVAAFFAIVKVKKDATVEAAETFTLLIANVSKTVTLVDDADLVPATVVSVSAPATSEGRTLVYTVQLSNSSIGQTFTIATSGTATNPADYTTPFSLSGGVTQSGSTLTVPAGISTFTVSVSTVNDLIVESAETLIMTVGGVSATGTINDDDVAASVASVTSPTVGEAGGVRVFTVTLTSPSLGQDFTYARTGTATPTTDFGAITFSNGVTLVGSTLSVPAGVTNFTASTTIVDDASIESSETIVLTIGGIVGTGVISDNDSPLASIVTSIPNVTVAEGALLTFNVTLNTATPSAQVFTLAFSGTATAGTDYASLVVVKDASGNTLTLTGNNFTLPQGNASFSVSTLTVTDAAAESTETLILTIQGVSGTGSITNVDNVPATILSVVGESVNEGGVMRFTITTNKPTIAGQKFTPTLTGGV